MRPADHELSDPEGSVSVHLNGIKQGEPDAIQAVYQRYLHRLLGLARHHLRASPKKVWDEEDVVQIAINQFFEQAHQGRWPQLNDREDLWQILAMLVDRRAKDLIRRLNTAKAGGGRVLTESIFVSTDAPSRREGIETVEAGGPSPGSEFELLDELEARMRSLDEQHRAIVSLKLSGYSNADIAEKTGYSCRTVERRLMHIRQSWEDDVSNE